LKPVFQTRIGDGRNGTPHGNCVAACYASLFECGIDEIPELSDPEVAPNQILAEEAFLAARGLALLYVHVGCQQYQPAPLPAYVTPDTWHMISGTSPRKCGHRVVGRGGEMVHDPHPDGGGLVDVRGYVFLVPLDPARRPV
jgi:hypothetical protein